MFGDAWVMNSFGLGDSPYSHLKTGFYYRYIKETETPIYNFGAFDACYPEPMGH